MRAAQSANRKDSLVRYLRMSALVSLDVNIQQGPPLSVVGEGAPKDFRCDSLLTRSLEFDLAPSQVRRAARTSS